MSLFFLFFFQAEDGIRDVAVTGVQTCALPISSFGEHGLLLPKLPAETSLEAVAVQSDGKIVVAGDVADNSGTQLLVARFKSNGALDPDFSGDGIFIMKKLSRFDIGHAIAIQKDGK